LTLTPTNNTATCYVASDESPSENASDQTLTASYSGTNVEEATRDLTVYKLTIEAPGKMVDIGNGGLVVPIMFNDDHDCGKTYTADWNCGVNCAGVSASGTCPDDTHRELEPVWDYLYAGTCEAEDDLVSIKVEIKPTNMAGDVKVKPTGSNLRIWKNAKKGDKNSIIADKTYSVSELPQTMYVEGIKINSDSISAEYIPPKNKTVGQTKMLDFEILSLIEEQNGARKIINENAKPIEFSVKGGVVFLGKYKWTVPGHNNAASIGTSSVITVTYGASGCNVTLPEDAANRRFTTTVSVTLDNGKLNLSRTIRVAQATYQGTAVATTLTTRRTEVPTLVTLPTMDPMPVNTSVPPNPPVLNSAADFDNKYGTDFTGNGNAKIRYATLLASGGLTVSFDSGVNRKIYAAMLSKKAYDAGLRLEDLTSIAEHEARHANQNIWMRAGNINWVKLEQNVILEQSQNFMEADAYTTNLKSNGSWRFINDSFGWFCFFYNEAETYFFQKVVNTSKANTNTVRNNADKDLSDAMRTILQDIYKNVPFQEMKRQKYNYRVRPPRYVKP
jgi:hypothetical protein